MTLSDIVARLHSCELTARHCKLWALADALKEVADELEGKVLVTPVTVELEPNVWVTRFPHIEVHGSSPEDSLASFVERVEEESK